MALRPSATNSPLKSGAFLRGFSDRLYGATVQRLISEGDFVIGCGLFFDKGVAVIFANFEDIRSDFDAEVAINALTIDVVFPWNVFGIFIGFVGHKIDVFKEI
jgi:hypothetical protein